MIGIGKEFYQDFADVADGKIVIKYLTPNHPTIKMIYSPILILEYLNIHYLELSSNGHWSVEV